MLGKILLVSVLVVTILLSGCPEPDPQTGYSSFRSDGTPYSGQGPYDDPNTTYYDTGTQGPDSQYDTENPGDEDCGYYEGPCCEYIGTDAFGMLTASNYCKDDLECRGGACVEGPIYETYDRTSGR